MKFKDGEAHLLTRAFCPLLFAFCLFRFPAHAATTTTWELNTYQDFLRGRLSGLSLTRDGRLVLGPKLEMMFSSDQPEIWSVTRAFDGTLYLATGHRGRLYKVDPSGRGSVVWTADQPEIFAVTVDAKGVVYAGTSPDGKVYRIENGKAAEYFAPRTRYIWALAFAPDGALMVATGDQGKIFRVAAGGQGEVYYETGQQHVTALAFDREGRLLAGSEPNGVLFRISSKDKAFALYDANLPEIRAIVPRPDGSIYAAALGGSLARRVAGATTTASTPSPPVVTAPAISVTVTDAQAGLDVKPKPEAPKAPPPAPQPAATPTADYAGVEKSALYRIHSDNTVETLWSSKEENIYDLLVSGDRIVFATDVQGRIYQLTPDRKATLVAQTNEGETTRLIDTPGGLLAATGNLGRIYRLAGDAASGGTYESPVHDAGSVARWGRLSWRADLAPATKLSFRTRAGNSARPDATWSDWSEPISDPSSSLITSPNARYIQWRVEFTGSSAGSPALDSVTVAYLPQNTPPVVRSINVTTQPSGAPKPSSPTAATQASYSITVTDSGEGPQPAGTPTQTLARTSSAQMQVSWQADDPDGDKLLYSLYFRGEGEREWKLLRAGMAENSYLLEPDVLADGRYWFKVVATDRPANPVNLARDAELVSPPVLIDNTPPALRVSAPRRLGNRLEIDVDAEDQTSALRRCEYSVDAGPWTPVEAADGVTDSPRERFLVRIDNLSPGEHLVAIRAFDAAGNAGVAKVVAR